MSVKKLICLFTVLSVYVGSLFADDVPYRQQRRDHFSQMPVTSESVVFLGNSITNFGVWPDMFECDGQTVVVNRGVSGNFAKEVLTHFDLVIAGKPKAVYLMIGINDVGAQGDIVPSVECMLRIAAEVSPDTRMYVQSILPTVISSRSNIPTRYNPLLRSLCDRYPNAQYVDVFTPMSKAGIRGITDDGLHPDWKGYRIWADVLEAATGLRSVMDRSAEYSYFTGKNFMDRMLGTYSLLPVGNDDVLMIGDGLVQQGEWPELFCGARNVKNRGLGLNLGNAYSLTADRLAAVVPKILHGGKPAKVFVHVGATDALNGTAHATIVAGIEQGVEELLRESPTTEVFVQCIMPLRDAWKNKSIIVPANKALKTYCEDKKGVEFVDIYDEFVGEGGGLAPRYQSAYSAGNGANIVFYIRWANLIAGMVGKPALKEVPDDYYAVKTSGDGIAHYYTITANGRYGNAGPNRYVTSQGTNAGLTGEFFNGRRNQQWMFVGRDGGYDIVNRQTGAYIDPSSAEDNNQLRTTTEVPEKVWTIDYIGRDRLCVIRSGEDQLHQTNSSLSHRIYNWGGGSNTTDVGCLFYLEEAGYALEPEYDEPEPQTLFSTLSGGMDIPPYRIPGITCGNGGRLIASCARLVSGTDPGYGQVDCVVRISDDNGSTWGTETEVAVGDATLVNNVKTPMEAAYGDPAVVMDRESDEVLVMAVGGCTVYANPSTNRENPNIIASIRSMDGGVTWERPTEQTEGIYGLFDKGNSIASAFVGGGRLFQSRIVKVGGYYRLYAALAARPNGNRVIYSDDFGRTWKALGGGSAMPIPDGDEPKCDEMPDGRVVVTSRTGGGRLLNFFTYTDTKAGEGKWQSECKATMSGLSASPSSNPTNGEMLIVPVRRKADGKEMYMALQSVPTGSGREDVGIFFKELEGIGDIKDVATFAREWDGFYQVSHTASAYSSMELQADGKIGFFYEETLTKWGMKQNPVSTSFPTGSGMHNFDGFENIYVALPLELITGGLYSVCGDIDRGAFVRAYYNGVIGGLEATEAEKSGLAEAVAKLGHDPSTDETDAINRMVASIVPADK